MIEFKRQQTAEALRAWTLNPLIHPVAVGPRPVQTSVLLGRLGAGLKVLAELRNEFRAPTGRKIL